MSKTTTLADIVSSNGSLIVPTGSTASRPSANAGSIRFNTDLNTLESANGIAWANVGSGGAGSSYSANTVDTGYLAIPIGTTAQRPVSAPLGALRWNSSNTGVEFYVGNNAWQMVASTSYNIEYLIVAGGGGAGSSIAGGGGAGGVITGALTSVNPGTSYTITVGAGGGGSSDGSVAATTGTNSSAFSQLAYGGGGGGSGASSSGNYTGKSGGSGGGGGGNDAALTLHPGGSGTAGQGNAGGTGEYRAPSYGGGGGGGAGAAGASATTSNAGAGGIGVTSSISGSSTYYGGGGGTVSYSSPGQRGLGGAGGGGDGGIASTGTAGTPNTGGGAGSNATNGGSGIIILRYLASNQRGNGGTVTTANGYFIHTFTSSSNFIA
jgi:hypothetical protein